MTDVHGGASRAGTAQLFDALRDGTADLHQQLEDRLDLASPRLTIEHYADAVGILAAAGLAIEAGLQRAFSADAGLAAQLGWPGRRKTDLLVGDLHILRRRLPCCVQPLVVDGAAQVVGVMYVMEGSTLGGQVVDSLVRRRLGEDTPRRSFVPYGSNARQRWNEFRDAAGTLTAADTDEAVAAARRTFELYLDVAETVLGKR